MKLTSTQLRKIIAEEVRRTAKNKNRLAETWEEDVRSRGYTEPGPEDRVPRAFPLDVAQIAIDLVSGNDPFSGYQQWTAKDIANRFSNEAAKSGDGKVDPAKLATSIQKYLDIAIEAIEQEAFEHGD